MNEHCARGGKKRDSLREAEICDLPSCPPPSYSSYSNSMIPEGKVVQREDAAIGTSVEKIKKQLQDNLVGPFLAKVLSAIERVRSVDSHTLMKKWGIASRIPHFFLEYIRFCFFHLARHVYTERDREQTRGGFFERLLVFCAEVLVDGRFKDFLHAVNHSANLNFADLRRVAGLKTATAIRRSRTLCLHLPLYAKTSQLLAK